MKFRGYFSALLAAFCLFYGTSVFPFGKNKVTYNEFRWRIMKTIHFDIY
jgi:hypothetical protein